MNNLIIKLKNKKNFYFINIIFNIILIINSCHIYNIYSNNIDNNYDQKLSERLSEIEQDIKNIDQQIAKKAKALNIINNNIIENKNKINQLNIDKKEQNEKLTVLKQKLINNLQTSYILNNKNNIDKFTNIENLQQFNRFINYLESINNYNNTNINNIKESLTKLEDLNNQLELVSKQQLDYKKQTITSYDKLKELKNYNLTLKNNLKQELNNQKTRITISQYNEENQRNNNTVIKSITNNTTVNIFKQNHSIKTAKGSLLLPVSGIINTNYKSEKSSNKAIFIKTSEGNPVKAIYNGQVVFSKWLRGFGFVIIINHGNNYMSLYGQNQTLLKNVGDIVEAGETIALTGSSGGNDEPGLYFELRHNGQAINALSWLKTDLYNRYAKQ